MLGPLVGCSRVGNFVLFVGLYEILYSWTSSSIRDTCGSWLPPSLYYNVIDAKGKSTLKVEGPACKFECLSTTTFRVSSIQHYFSFNELFFDHDKTMFEVLAYLFHYVWFSRSFRQSGTHMWGNSVTTGKVAATVFLVAAWQTRKTRHLLLVCILICVSLSCTNWKQ